VVQAKVEGNDVVRPAGFEAPEPRKQPADLAEILRASVAAVKDQRGQSDGAAKSRSKPASAKPASAKPASAKPASAKPATRAKSAASAKPAARAKAAKPGADADDAEEAKTATTRTRARARKASA
jgi:hypothetical protein